MPARILACLLPVLLIGLPASESRGDEEKIPVKELPGAVRKAAKAKFPKAEIVGASKEEEDGKTTFEVMLKHEGRGIDVTMAADGKILEIEKEIDDDDLPSAVKKAIAAKYPGAKIGKVEQLIQGEDGPVRYEVAITAEVVLDAKGKIQKGEDKEDEHEKRSSAKDKKSKKGDDKEDDDDDEDEDDD